jgi:hypothetical protein
MPKSERRSSGASLGRLHDELAVIGALVRAVGDTIDSVRLVASL